MIFKIKYFFKFIYSFLSISTIFLNYFFFIILIIKFYILLFNLLLLNYLSINLFIEFTLDLITNLNAY